MEISIVIPAYNCEKTVGRCLESIINQCRDCIGEIIAVNDGSKDGTLGVLRHYADFDGRIVIVDKENGGVSSARNAGIEKAKCSHIMFVDSDDELKTGFVSTLISKGKDADLTVGGIELQRECGNSDIAHSGVYSALDAVKNYGKNIPTLLLNGPTAKIFKRDIVLNNSIKFDPAISLGEDTLFVFEYIKHCKSVLFADVPGYIYYQLGSSSLMTKFNPQNYYTAKYVYRCVLGYASEMNNGEYPENMEKVYSNVLMHYIRNAVANRKKCSNEHIESIISDYISDPVVRAQAKKKNGVSIVQRAVNFLTERKMSESLNLLLTLHVKIRGQ